MVEDQISFHFSGRGQNSHPCLRMEGDAAAYPDSKIASYSSVVLEVISFMISVVRLELKFPAEPKNVAS